MATLKQKAVKEKLLESIGKPIGEAMREVGYADNTADNPKLLTDSKGWAELMEEALPDSLLNRVHMEGLEATKVNSSHTEPDYAVPDYAVRHKYLETAYKLKKRLTDKTEIDGRLEVVLTRG